MKHLLFVAYLFPPQGGGGVQRSAKFVKYLPHSGWQPVVLTAPIAGGGLQDMSLAAEIPSQTPVVRVRGAVLPHFLPWRVRRWLARWLLVVDEQLGWLPFAARRGLQLARERPVQALYSTSGPYTDHLVGLRLKRATGLPWLADWRDPWLGNESAAFPTGLHQALCARLERAIIFEASRVLVVSEPMRRDLLARYPALPPEQVVTLPNGFDPADLEGIEPAPRDERLTVVYTGSFYGSRTARPFLAALRQVLEVGLVPRAGITVRLVGNTGQDAAQAVADWHLSDVVQLGGYVSHRDVLAQQLAADALLLIVGAGPGSDVVLTAKIFEYLATRRPILGLVPPGAAATLLHEAQAGSIVPPDDVQTIAQALVTLYADWHAGRLHVSPDPAVVARHDRRLQAGQLAALLDEVAS